MIDDKYTTIISRKRINTGRKKLHGSCIDISLLVNVFHLNKQTKFTRKFSVNKKNQLSVTVKHYAQIPNAILV